MQTTRHGLAIGIERTGEQFFLTMKIQGKLTHEDYTVITPMLDAALAQVKKPSINAFIDATEVDGWEARAAWDDFKLGLSHGNEFRKIAICGNNDWLESLTRVANWFVSGDIQYFESTREALIWLHM
ncbi:STAS/SEC14 domain-containing protein [Alteromonas sp. ASW11-19]|uniref:STAS/SEC14 domain-containing protein n=1 Tax=Alteromonas salexigens TaxID=2982530 RepID=A0ABT2VPU4_9ALTE|nr:STAS/SEC14 domain-containing protein [Alteromonas salexigens]MCU7555325.1 STAS/SEC14 domain-containing protein [Alteromonas salexigens]